MFAHFRCELGGEGLHRGAEVADEARVFGVGRVGVHVAVGLGVDLGFGEGNPVVDRGWCGAVFLNAEARRRGGRRGFYIISALSATLRLAYNLA